VISAGVCHEPMREHGHRIAGAPRRSAGGQRRVGGVAGQSHGTVLAPHKLESDTGGKLAAVNRTITISVTATLIARLPPDGTATGEPAPGRAGGQGHARACHLHSGPGACVRRAGPPSGFPAGGILRASRCPSWVVMYAPPGSSAIPATASWSRGWAVRPLGELGVNGADVREDGSSHR